MPAGRRSTTCCADRFSSAAARAAARAAREAGGRILDIGVGTGLSFDDYDASTEITGIDAVGADDRAGAVAGGERPLPVRERAGGHGCAQSALRGCEFRLRGRAVRHHAGRESRTRVVGMRAGGSARAGRSFWSIIFIRNAGWRPPSSACWRKRRARSGCGPSFRSRGWRPGRGHMAAPN